MTTYNNLNTIQSSRQCDRFINGDTSRFDSYFTKVSSSDATIRTFVPTRINAESYHKAIIIQSSFR